MRLSADAVKRIEEFLDFADDGQIVSDIRTLLDCYLELIKEIPNE